MIKKVGIIVILCVLFSTVYSVEYLNKENSLSTNYIKSFYNKDDKIYICTANGLFLYNPKEKTTQEIKIDYSQASSYVTSIAFNKNNIILGTSKGLLILNSKDNSVEKVYNIDNGLSDNYITDVEIFNDKIYAATQYWGINVIDIEQNTIMILTDIEIGSNQVNDLDVDIHYIAVATEEGFTLYDKNTGEWYNYTLDFGLNNIKITSVRISGDKVYLGTKGGGVNIYDLVDESFDTITMENGIKSDYVLSVELVGNVILIGTFEGLSIYNKNSNTVKNFTMSEWLPENSVSDILYHNNYLYVATDGGGVTIKEYTIPYIELSRQINYPGDGLIKFKYKIDDYDSISVQYAIDGFNDLWYEIENAEFRDGSLIIDNKKLGLIDGIYYLKVTITKNGISNYAIMIFEVDTQRPVMSINEIPSSTREKSVTVSGHVKDDNLKELTLMPFNKKIEFDKFTGSFSVDIPLQKNVNEFSIKAVDLMSNVSEYSTTINLITSGKSIVLNKPVSRSSKQMISITGSYYNMEKPEIYLYPGKISALIDYEKKTYSGEISLSSKKNNVYAVAVTGKETFKTDSYTVNYESSVSSMLDLTESASAKAEVNIFIDNNQFQTETAEVDVELLNSDIKRCEIFPDNKKINFQKNRESINVRLFPGPNNIELKFYDNLGLIYDTTIMLVYDNEPPLLFLDKLEYNFNDKTYYVDGHYKENNMDKMIVNNNIPVIIDYSAETYRFFVNDVSQSLTIRAVDKTGQDTELILNLSQYMPAGNNFSTTISKTAKENSIIPSGIVESEIIKVYYLKYHTDNKKLLKEHRDYLESMKRVNPNNIIIRYLLGLFYLDINKPDLAVGEFQFVLKWTRTMPMIYIYLSKAYFLKREYNKAIEAINTSIKINETASAYNMLGMIKIKMKDISSAKDAFIRAIKLEGNFSDAYNNLGILYYKLNDYSKAKHYFKKAIELNPVNAEYKKNLDVLYK